MESLAPNHDLLWDAVYNKSVLLPYCKGVYNTARQKRGECPINDHMLNRVSVSVKRPHPVNHGNYPLPHLVTRSSKVLTAWEQSRRFAKKLFFSFGERKDAAIYWETKKMFCSCTNIGPMKSKQQVVDPTVQDADWTEGPIYLKRCYGQLSGNQWRKYCTRLVLCLTISKFLIVWRLANYLEPFPLPFSNLVAPYNRHRLISQQSSALRIMKAASHNVV